MTRFWLQILNIEYIIKIRLTAQRHCPANIEPITIIRQSFTKEGLAYSLTTTTNGIEPLSVDPLSGLDSIRDLEIKDISHKSEVNQEESQWPHF